MLSRARLKPPFHSREERDFILNQTPATDDLACRGRRVTRKAEASAADALECAIHRGLLAMQQSVSVPHPHVTGRAPDLRDVLRIELAGLDLLPDGIVSRLAQSHHRLGARKHRPAKLKQPIRIAPDNSVDRFLIERLFLADRLGDGSVETLVAPLSAKEGL